MSQSNEVFGSDGCTWFPDGSWSHCCYVHDWAYWAGTGRWAADVALGQCVFEATGSFSLALSMTTGVVLIGWAFYRRK